MATKLGEAFVKVTTRLRSLRAGLFDARKMVATAARNMGATLTLAVSAPLLLMAKRMIDFAGDAEDSEARFAQVMGNMAGSVRAWSKELNRAIGISEFMARKVVGDFTSILLGSELTRKESVKFSQRLIELAADMRAVTPGSTLEQALNAIRSGLAGVSIPLRRFGVDISGLKRGGDRATDTIARMDEILKRAKLAGIFGQAAREADNFTGVMIDFRGAMDDITIIFGSAFIPSLTKAIKLFTTIVTPVLKFVGAIFKNTIVLKTLVGFFGVLAIVIPPIIFFVGQLALSFISIKASLVLLRANTDRYTNSIRSNTSALAANATALTVYSGAAVTAGASTAVAAQSTGIFSKIIAGIGLARLFKWLSTVRLLGFVFRGFGKVIAAVVGGPLAAIVVGILVAIDVFSLLWSWLGKTEQKAKGAAAALKDAASAASAGFGATISQSGIAAIAGGGFAGAFSSPASSTPTGGREIPRKAVVSKLDDILNTLKQVQLMPTSLPLL